MNRETRRKLKLTKDEGNMFDVLSRWKDSPNNVSAGDRVKLNWEQISGRTDYARMNANYREFVDKNKDIVLTVGEELNSGTARNLVSFVEDNTWLFWVGDLVKV